MPGLAYERAGSGEPLLLVHGLGVTRRCWDPLVPALARHHELLRHDLPGFGQSAPLPPGVPRSAHAFADALEHELDARGTGRVHVVGHSMGGWIALELAVRGRARTVTALAPTGGWTPREARYVRRATTRMRLGAQAIRPVARLAMAAAPARRHALRLTNAFGERVPPAAAVEAVREMAVAESFWAARKWFVTRTPSELEQITCPTVIVWGTNDRLLWPQQGHRLVERIEDAELVELPGLGHDLMHDGPDPTARTILRHTGGVPVASTTRRNRARGIDSTERSP